MYKIEAIIKPIRLDAVRAALVGLGVSGMTVIEVKGFGRQHGHMETYRGVGREVQFVPKVKIEVVVPGGLKEKVIQALIENASTGTIGDGKIFVIPLSEAIRIRTGELGEAAL
jgi:nitrogen regulatory protein P-II 1